MEFIDLTEHCDALMAINPINPFDATVYLGKQIIMDVWGLLEVEEIDITHFDGSLDSLVHQLRVFNSNLKYC